MPNRHERAREFDCPECDATPGNPCVLLSNGETSERSHNGRLRTLWEWEKETERQASLEYLRKWLAEFGDIFKE